MDTILCQLSVTDRWTAHLRQRIDWAREIHLLDPSAGAATESAQIFLPSGTNVDAVGPDDSLRFVLSAPIPKDRWTERPDLYREIAGWLLAQRRNEPRWSLLCEAGLSELGDTQLSGRPYVAFRDRPYYALALHEADRDFVAKVMRWGRTWQRFLGVAVEASLSSPTFEYSRGLFLCDGLDGDSLIVAPIQEAGAA